PRAGMTYVMLGRKGRVEMPRKLPHLLCSSLLASVLICGAANAAEQPYPSKAIRFIVPTAPGGGSDLVVRMLGQKYTAAWGQPVVVDHRAGAGMTIGIDLTAKAAPDGYTLVLVNPSHAIRSEERR